MRNMSGDITNLETKKLIRALEVGLYGGPLTREQHGLLNLLYKLGVKSAAVPSLTIGLLNMEPLSAVLSAVTYDIKELKPWKKPVNLNDDSESI